MNRCYGLACLILGTTCYATSVSPGGDGSTAKEALQEVQSFVGAWKGNGTLERDKNAIWKENAVCSWKFKDKDSWLIVDFKDSKFFKSGELRYLTDKKLYQLTLTDKKDQALVFQGELKKSTLILERLDPATKETQQLKLNSADDGDRLVLAYWVKAENRTAFNQEWRIGMTREGVKVAGGKKGPECVVTGGLGTIAVKFKDATYYVCCSGCRDAFYENPAKVIAEYEANKKKQ
jgi:hypothetical protein